MPLAVDQYAGRRDPRRRSPRLAPASQRRTTKIMGVSVRYLFVEPDDSVVLMSMARYGRIASGQGRVAKFAGKSVRVAEIVVDLLDRRPVAIKRSSYFLMQFTAEGKVDLLAEEERTRAAVDLAAGAVLGDARREGNLVPASSRFAKRRLEASQWEPSYQLRKRLIEAALGQ